MIANNKRARQKEKEKEKENIEPYTKPGSLIV